MAVKAKKAAIAVPQSYDAADALLLEYGQLARALAVVQGGLAEDVAALTARIEETASPLKERQKAIAAQLQAYAEARRDELTDGGKTKSHDMPAGRIGWRANPPSVQIRRGLKLSALVETILSLGLRRKFLRMKLELNKDAMLADPDKAEAIPGITIARDIETFYLEPKGAELSAGAP